MNKIVVGVIAAVLILMFVRFAVRARDCELRGGVYESYVGCLAPEAFK